VFLSKQSNRSPARLAILAGSFNPPTVAHLALAEAALRRTDEVLFVLPRHFPHKAYVGASLEERIDMLNAVVSGNDRFSIGVSDGGLFLDIAAEAKDHYPQAELWFVCGRDAAERIMNWDYGDPHALLKMMESFGLLVARRQGEYTPPDQFTSRIESLLLENYDEHTSTNIRERIAAGEEWKHLVCESIAGEVARIYS